MQSFWWNLLLLGQLFLSALIMKSIYTSTGVIACLKRIPYYVMWIILIVLKHNQTFFLLFTLPLVGIRKLKTEEAAVMLLFTRKQTFCLRTLLLYFNFDNRRCAYGNTEPWKADILQHFLSLYDRYLTLTFSKFSLFKAPSLFINFNFLVSTFPYQLFILRIHKFKLRAENLEKSISM